VDAAADDAAARAQGPQRGGDELADRGEDDRGVERDRGGSCELPAQTAPTSRAKA
jgi:hypothetical protein